MVNKLKFKISYYTVTPHDPDPYYEDMIVEAYNKDRAMETFYQKTKSEITHFDKIEELTEEKTFKVNAK